MTFKEQYDNAGYQFVDSAITIANIRISTGMYSGSVLPHTYVDLFDENGGHIWNVWPIYQDIPIEVGRYNARTYLMSGSLTILTEKL